MKKYVLAFLKRGAMAAAGGPVVLAIVYGILGACGVVDSFSPMEVTRGILTVTLLAFTAGGITVVYSVEQLSLMSAIILHGVVLYLDYILIYLVNGWLKTQLIPILIFTVSFVLGFGIIWLCIYLSIQKKIRSINTQLKKKI